MKMKLGARRRLGIAIRAAVLLACLCVVLVPFYIIVTNSFKPYADIARDIFSLPSENFTFDNYLSAWDRLNFGNSLNNTAIITVLSNFGGVVLERLSDDAAGPVQKLASYHSNLHEGAFQRGLLCLGRGAGRANAVHTAIVYLLYHCPKTGAGGRVCRRGKGMMISTAR